MTVAGSILQLRGHSDKFDSLWKFAHIAIDSSTNQSVSLCVYVCLFCKAAYGSVRVFHIPTAVQSKPYMWRTAKKVCTRSWTVCAVLMTASQPQSKVKPHECNVPCKVDLAFCLLVILVPFRAFSPWMKRNPSDTRRSKRRKSAAKRNLQNASRSKMRIGIAPAVTRKMKRNFKRICLSIFIFSFFLTECPCLDDDNA